MKRALFGCLFVLLSSVSASAQWEVSFLGGWTAPFIEESFVYSPDIDFPDIPGASFRQDGNFTLTGRGSFAFGGSVAYFFSEHLAIEGRVDTVGFDIDTSGPLFTADVDFGLALPATVALDLGMGEVQVERLFPMSFNLKARTGGNTRFIASAGISYLPRVRFKAAQPVSLAVGGFGIEPFELASVLLEAGAVDSGDSKWGFNMGAGVDVQISPSVSLVGDVRFYGFQPQTFVWQRSENPSMPLEEILVSALMRLPPIQIQVLYFQATGGIAFRF